MCFFIVAPALVLDGEESVALFGWNEGKILYKESEANAPLSGGLR